MRKISGTFSEIGCLFDSFLMLYVMVFSCVPGDCPRANPKNATSSLVRFLPGFVGVTSWKASGDSVVVKHLF